MSVSRAGVEASSTSRAAEETYDGAVTDALPAVAAGLGVVSLALAVLQVLTVDGAAGVALVSVSGGTALACAACVLVTRRWRLPGPYAHPVTAALLLLVVAGGVTGLVLTEQPQQTTTVMLAVAGSGAVLLSWRYLAATHYLAWGAWAAGALLVGPSPQWPHYTAGMVAATLFAVAICLVRRRGARALSEARAAAEAVAIRDQLTGLANRRGLALVGTQIVEHARRQGDAVHCVFVDVDGLGHVNRSLGHAAGDEVMVAVADALRAVTRSTDVIARWGGDEFCVIGPGPGMAPLELERRVRDSVLHHPPVPEETWSPQVIAGGAMLEPWDSGSLDTLLGKADQEMHLRRSRRREDHWPRPRTATAD